MTECNLPWTGTQIVHTFVAAELLALDAAVERFLDLFQAGGVESVNLELAIGFREASRDTESQQYSGSAYTAWALTQAGTVEQAQTKEFVRLYKEFGAVEIFIHPVVDGCISMNGVRRI